MAWSFREAPAVGDKRHYIKAASAPGHEGYEVTMTVKPEAPDHKLDIHWVGIGKARCFLACRRLCSQNCFCLLQTDAKCIQVHPSG